MRIKCNDKYFSKLTIIEGKNLYHGVNGILTHHHIICDPYLGLDGYSIRRISCDFIDQRNVIYLPWNPYLVPKDWSRYSSVKMQILSNIRAK